MQAVSNAGYWLLSVTDKHLLSMAGAVFFENLCGGMGTAAFVALLMTLCNKSFSATQFALLSALSAVGRVYVGPVAGWFVEAYGWPAFYLFSVAAAVPGLLLLQLCKGTLEYMGDTGKFMRRQAYPAGYRFALRLLLLGCVLAGVWLLIIISNALGLSALTFGVTLLEAGIVLALAGIVLGCLLDYLALRNSSACSEP